ncbi:MAG: hypothetical protein M3O06_07155 [Pseudomonadota bacterium]|nr:hypothetical protein [Pseudomonadota bacterium]
MFVYGGFDAPALISRGVVEIRFEAARDVDRRIIESSKEKPFGLIVVEPNAELPVHFANSLDDLGGVAHGYEVYRSMFDSSSDPCGARGLELMSAIRNFRMHRPPS